MNQQHSMQYIDDNERPKVKLEASTSARVVCDQMTAWLSTEARGNSPSALNKEVIKAVNEAMALAKSYPTVKAVNDDIETSQPWRYEGKNGEEVEYVVTGSITLSSTDKAAIAELAGKLALTMRLNNIDHSVSEARRKEETNKLMQALGDEFRQRASDITQAFGYNRYVIRALDISGGGNDIVFPSMPVRTFYSMTVEGARNRNNSDESLSTEGGDMRIDLRASGTIELL